MIQNSNKFTYSPPQFLEHGELIKSGKKNLTLPRLYEEKQRCIQPLMYQTNCRREPLPPHSTLICSW